MKPDDPCPVWEDGRHLFVLMLEKRRGVLEQVNDALVATHKICSCGLVVPRAGHT